MPVPYQIPKDFNPAESVEESQGFSNLLLFPGTKFVAATPKERVLAHSIDAVLVHGFSLYVAKWVSVAMAAYYSQQIAEVGYSTELFFVSVLGFAMPKIWVVTFSLFSFFYLALCQHFLGRTLGKAVTGLRIVADAKSERMSLQATVKRYFAYVFSYCSCGAAFWLGYHESITGARVVKEK